MKKFVKMISTAAVMGLLMASLAACGKKETGNYSGSFRMYLYDTIGWVSLAYSFVV